MKWVEANEPNTLKYELKREVNKKTGVECLILVERCPSRIPLSSKQISDSLSSYSDMAALKAHGASETFAAFQKAMLAEGLAGAPAQLKFVKPVAGFSRL